VPTIRRLIVERGKLHVVDEIRKLTFSGTLVAAEQAGKDDPSALKIRCSGTLNGKPFALNANGGPLLDLDPGKPYSLKADLTASDIHLDAHVTVRKPFDLGALDVDFAITGDDLADVFYLTGLALPNTPRYRLTATVHVDGTSFRVDDLRGRLGTSDIAGRGEIQTGGLRPKLTAKLSSVNLNMPDLEPTVGAPAPRATSLSANDASGKPRSAKPEPRGAPPPTDDGRLLPDADLQVNRVRGMDADVTSASRRISSRNGPALRRHWACYRRRRRRPSPSSIRVWRRTRTAPPSSPKRMRESRRNEPRSRSPLPACSLSLIDLLSERPLPALAPARCPAGL